MNLPFLKSPYGEDPVIVEGVFNTTASTLFRAWTTPDEIKAWFGAGETGPSSAKIDLRKGGRWEFMYVEADGQIDTLRGEYVEIKENVLLIFTWEHERSSPDGGTETTPQSLVTLDFKETENGVRLRLLHERIGKESGRLGVGVGWNASFKKLKVIIERST